MAEGSVGFCRQRLVVPGDAGPGRVPERRGKMPRGNRAQCVTTESDIQGFGRAGVGPQLVVGLRGQAAVVPLQARVERHAGIKQGGLPQKRFDHKQAGQRLAHEGGFGRSAVALADGGHQLGAEELPESG